MYFLSHVASKQTDAMPPINGAEYITLYVLACNIKHAYLAISLTFEIK